MDSLIAIKGKDFVIIAADTTNVYSVLRMKVILITCRTTKIKFGIQMEKNYLPQEDNIQIFQSLEITFKKISPFSASKMDTNCPLMIQHNTSDQNWLKQSEKVHTVSIAYQLDSKETNLDSIGLITQDLLLKQIKQPMDTHNIQCHQLWTLFKRQK